MTLPTITIHNLDDDVKFGLSVRAVDHGRSMEEEARPILSDGVGLKPSSRDLARVVRARYGPASRVDLEFLPRAYAAIAVTHRSAGCPVAPADCQIAAIARSHNMSVATRTSGTSRTSTSRSSIPGRRDDRYDESFRARQDRRTAPGCRLEYDRRDERPVRTGAARRYAGEKRMRKFIPALFVKMFGDPVHNPMGWEVESLGKLAVQTQYGTSKKANDRIEGFPVLRMGNVTYDGCLDCADLKYVMLPGIESAKYALKTGDILFNRTNSKEFVGKTGVWDGRFAAVAVSYFIRVRLDETRVCPIYVWAFMNSNAMKRSLFSLERGAIGQANINAPELHSLTLPIPPLAHHHRFAELVETTRSTVTMSGVATDTAAALSKTLMSRLLENGE